MLRANLNQTDMVTQIVINLATEKSAMQLSQNHTVETPHTARATQPDGWLVIIIAVCTVIWPGPANAVTVQDVDADSAVATQLVGHQPVKIIADEPGLSQDRMVFGYTKDLELELAQMPTKDENFSLVPLPNTGKAKLNS